MIDNPDKVQVLYFPFPHDDLQTEGLIVSPRDIDLRPRVGIVLPYAMYGSQARLLRSDANGNLGVNIQGAAGPLAATFQDTLGHSLGPLVPESGGAYAAPFSLPTPMQTNLVAPRTDAASVNLADFVAPPFYESSWGFFVSAVSGGATISFILQWKTTQGDYSGVQASSNISTTGIFGIFVGPALAQQMVSPTYRIRLSIGGGTSPSITWYCDQLYR